MSSQMIRQVGNPKFSQIYWKEKTLKKMITQTVNSEMIETTHMSECEVESWSQEVVSLA